MLDTAFILAAGLGTRMRPLTEHSAKPLLHFRGERLIERHLRRLSDAGFQHAIINCSWHGQLLRQMLGDGSRYGLSIQYSCEDKAPLETASGIARAAALIGSNPFLLLNGDIWTDINLQKLRSTTHKACIVLVENPAHNPRGDFALNDSNQVRVSGKKMLTYAGIGIFTTRFVKTSALTGERLGNTLRAAAERGTLRGITHNCEWFDIGTPLALSNQSPLSNKQAVNTGISNTPTQ